MSDLISSRLCLQAMVMAQRLRHALRRRRNASKRMEAERTLFYRRVWRQAAEAIGATVDRLGDEVLDIRLAGVATRVQRNYTAADDMPTLRLAGNKPLVARLLAEHGLPVPAWRQFNLSSLEEAIEFMRSGGGDYVVKPARDTGAGAGVTTHLRNRRQLLWAAARAAVYSDDLHIEEQVAGDNYRLLYLDGVLLDAVLRRPPSVTGDGRSTVRALLDRVNRARLASGASAAQTLVTCDLDMRHTLARQGLTPASVPSAGQTVRLKTVINDNAAYDNLAATHLLCDAVIVAGAHAAAALGVKLAGIDIITSDPSRPLTEVGGVILEVNTTPGFYYHYHRTGAPSTIAVDVLNYLLGSAVTKSDHVYSL